MPKHAGPPHVSLRIPPDGDFVSHSLLCGLLLYDVKVPNGQKVPAKGPHELQVRLGRAIKAERQRLGITQEELAWRADMHRTYIADIERGVRNITLKSIANLAEALEVSVASLLAPAEAGRGHVAPAPSRGKSTAKGHRHSSE
ncbi:MAG TPA: helix-turn-helix transcriptional regulator [Lacunisphaera sp.]|nr:helix-turn-helix transcriptional regulator [Lacunisphaera sp.]